MDHIAKKPGQGIKVSGCNKILVLQYFLADVNMFFKMLSICVLPYVNLRKPD